MLAQIEHDACELLDADHVAVKHLFVEYARLALAMPQDSVERRSELALQICSELSVHARIEEEIFYPALRDAAPEASSQLQEAQQEHDRARELIAQVQALGTAGAEMDECITKLAMEVEHHVKEERDILFPKARTCGLDLAALAAQLRQRQQDLQAGSSI